MHASNCNASTLACVSLEVDVNTFCNEKYEMCPSAISRRLRQYCVCASIDRNHTHYMSLKTIYQTNEKYLNELQQQNNVLNLSADTHNKLTDYLRIKRTVISRLIVMAEKELECSIWYRMLAKHCMYVCMYAYDNFRLSVTYLKHSSSDSKFQYSPQLNLWNGLKSEIIRSKSLHKQTHSSSICICNRMSTSSNVIAATRKLFEQNSESVDLSNGHKRQVSVSLVSSHKKAKGKGNTFQRPPFWFGYHTLNAIACNNNEPLEPTHSVSQLVKLGMAHSEALEHLEAVPSFPYIPQEAWPSKRIDGKEGGHFNLTQVPFDVEVDEGGFALDYQIAITFELGEKP